MYESELEAELEDLIALLSESDLETEAEMFSPAPTGPIFDVACAGCADQCVACPDGQCAHVQLMAADVARFCFKPSSKRSN